MSQIRTKAILLGVVVGMGILIYFFLPQLWLPPWLWAHTRFSRSEQPGLYAVPTSRKVTPPVVVAQKQTISTPDLTLSVPWSTPPREKEKGFVHIFSFANRKLLMVTDHAGTVNLLDELVSNHPENFDNAEASFGKDAISSRYKFLSAVLNTTPDAIKIFMPLRESVAKSTLLISKGLVLYNDGPIYQFEVSNIKGFQFGIPNGTNGIPIIFFDSRDRQYGLIFQGAQGDIDFALSSIHLLN